MLISMIAAFSENRVLGHKGRLPWSLPDDLARFKRVTSGHATIMGRSTFQTLLGPLPNRHNIVISRTAAQGDVPEGVTLARTAEEALEAARSGPCGGADRVYIVGGGQIYDLYMDRADELDVTEVHAKFEGDAFFPDIDPAVWRETARDARPADVRHGHAFAFVRYERR